MITEPMMYWITRLDAIEAVAAVALSVSIVAAIFYGTCLFLISESPQDFLRLLQDKVNTKIRKGILWAMGIFIAVLVFLPSTKELAMIYAVPAITRSDVVREDLPELYDYGIKALKQQLIEWSEPKENHRA